MIDLNNKIVACPLSGGINSAAVLCWLIESGMQPLELHLYYADFKEHSPGTLDFVKALMRMAKDHFRRVITKITYNSVLDFFESQKMIPHPKVSPCSQLLKIEPMLLYNALNNVQFDLIGYVRSEKSRIGNNKGKNDLFLQTAFPIADFTDEWCFQIVEKHVGWYPVIYKLRWNDAGFKGYVKANLHRFDEYTQNKLLKKLGTDNPVFKHNNCLPCKNMYVDDMLAIEYFFPRYMKKAQKLSVKLKSYYGRDAEHYYTAFGREDYEPGQCSVCAFD